MTQIITAATNKSFLLASDSRLNYFSDIYMSNGKYQEIHATADCIQKTFYIQNAKIGIQFLGIGYFPDGTNRYPLSYFIPKLNDLDFKHKKFSTRCELIYNFLNNLSEEGNTGQYVKGIMAGFQNHIKHVCTFNTCIDQLEIRKAYSGNYINSEKTRLPIIRDETVLTRIIEQNIKKQSDLKPWSIGGPIDILKVTKYSGKFLRKNNFTVDYDQNELVDSFKNNISKINGQLLVPPVQIKYE